MIPYKGECREEFGHWRGSSIGGTRVVAVRPLPFLKQLPHKHGRCPAAPRLACLALEGVSPPNVCLFPAFLLSFLPLPYLFPLSLPTMFILLPDAVFV